MEERYLQSQLITYLGNKRALLPFLGSGLDLVKQRLGRTKLNTLDLFSGSGVVARYFKAHSNLLIANDLETYSRIVNECYLTNESAVDQGALQMIAATLKGEIASNPRPGFFTELYSPQDEYSISATDRCFYTRRNALFLDTARQAIAGLPLELQKFFLAPLLARASVHANTAGVFKGFYKNSHGRGQFGGNAKDALGRIRGEIALDLPIFSVHDCEHRIFQEDALTLVDSLPEVDLAYLDPPYNQHPYGSNYFMLNLLAEYRRPEQVSRVSGIPVDWKRSCFNQRAKAESAILDLVARCRARFILLSYNSEGFVSKDSFLAGLRKLGEVTVMEKPYHTFKGSRNLRSRPGQVLEYLFLLERT